MITDQVLQDRIQELLYLGFRQSWTGAYVVHKYNLVYSIPRIQSFDAERWVEELDYLYHALRGSGK